MLLVAGVLKRLDRVVGCRCFKETGQSCWFANAEETG